MFGYMYRLTLGQSGKINPDTVILVFTRKVFRDKGRVFEASRSLGSLDYFIRGLTVAMSP